MEKLKKELCPSLEAPGRCILWGNSSVMTMIWEEGAERWSGHLGGTQANIQGNWSLAENY